MLVSCFNLKACLFWIWVVASDSAYFISTLSNKLQMPKKPMRCLINPSTCNWERFLRFVTYLKVESIEINGSSKNWRKWFFITSLYNSPSSTKPLLFNWPSFTNFSFYSFRRFLKLLHGKGEWLSRGYFKHTRTCGIDPVQLIQIRFDSQWISVRTPNH